MKRILAIDPGTEESQYVVWDGSRVHEHGLCKNNVLISRFEGFWECGLTSACIEMVASYGMAVGREVFETVYWIGRFDERLRALGLEPERIVRMDVKMHLCHSARAKDANVRQAIIDRFGGKVTAIGNKRAPGPLYGISSHAWAALGLAITFNDTRRQAAA